MFVICTQRSDGVGGSARTGAGAHRSTSWRGHAEQQRAHCPAAGEEWDAPHVSPATISVKYYYFEISC